MEVIKRILDPTISLHLGKMSFPVEGDKAAGFDAPAMSVINGMVTV